MGDFSEGLEPIAHCLRLSPTDPFSPVFVSLAALAHYHLGNYDEALCCSEEALRRGRHYVVLRTMAATLGQLGRRDEAGAVLAEIERLRPVDLESHWRLTCPYARAGDEAKSVEGLRKAGYKEAGLNSTKQEKRSPRWTESLPSSRRRPTHIPSSSR